MTLEEKREADQTAKASNGDGSGYRGPIVRVFGGTGISDDGGSVDIGGRRQRRLLALLATRAGSLVDVDWLAEYLWDDDERPEATTPALRTSVYRLRAALPEAARAWIQTEPQGYRLAAPDEAVEHLHFTGLRAAATSARQREDPQTALALLDEALDLWHGDPFRELEDLEWAYAEIERLRMDRLEMMEERWAVALELGRHTQIIGELAAFTTTHADRDRAVRQYALALHRSGRTAEALKVIATHKKVLVEEYGLDPSTALSELESALLAGDPALDMESTGRPLRGYRLLDEIGVGAFSIVWRSIQPSVGREVAIKQIRSELANRPEFIRSFESEAHLVARIEHPHVVPLIDYWREPDSAYLVMRLLRGGSLEQRLRAGPLDIHATLAVARQVGAALGAAHSRGVVHRDVKPANILFDEQGNAFLGDFGIALDAMTTDGEGPASFMGSPAYASPEQIRRGSIGPQADVFSLATVLYECLSGSAPFSAVSSVDELVERQLGVPYPALSGLDIAVQSAVSDAISRATEKAPADRYVDVAAFIDALESGAVEAADRGGARSAETDTPDVEIANPYIGLRAFDEVNAERYFGRDRLIGDLLEHIRGNEVASRSLVVVGPSGSGKSSVVRAGLVPALRRGAIDGSSAWYATAMVPGSDPYEALEAALLRIAVNPPPSLLEQLRADERGILRGIRRCLPSDDDELVLVIDQFEEIFTGRASADANAFLRALSVAVTERSSPLRLVATLRADYYDRPLEHPDFAPLLGPATVTVTPLTGDELEQAIIGPARRLGIEYESGLAARIAAETAGQTSPLPLLQYTLLELFERRDRDLLTIEAYEEIGGLSGAVAARAESLYLEADAATRATIRNVFGSLTDPGAASADLRRRVEIADLRDDAATATVLERFGAARLLTFDRDVKSREPTVEVAHEALLREWPRLVTWLAEDIELLRAADALGDATDRWLESDRANDYLLRGGRLGEAESMAAIEPARLRQLDLEFVAASTSAAHAEERSELTRRRRLRLLATGVGAAVIVALIAGGFGLLQQDRAQDEAQAASIAERRAELVTLVRRATEEPDAKIALLLALEAQRRAPGPETDTVLLTALQRVGGTETIESFAPLATGSCAGVWPGWVARDGMSQTAAVNGIAVRRDLGTGEVTEYDAMPGGDCGDWYGDEDSGRRYAVAEGRDRLWLGPLGGPWQTDLKLDGQSWVGGPAGFAGSRLLLEGPGSVRLIDSTSGVPIGGPIIGLAEDPLVLLSPDGRLFAAAAAPDGAARLTSLTVHDAADATRIFEVDVPGVATALLFDQAGNELLVGTSEGRLVSVDLQSGEIVGDVAARAQAIDELTLRDDGRVGVISVGPPGTWELLDRRRGPVGEDVTGLDNVVGGVLQDDGTLVAWNPELRVDVLALESRPLVSRAIDLEPSDLAGPNDMIEIYDGNALVLDWGGPNDVLIELATGERTPLDMRTKDGGQLRGEPMLVDGGYAVVSADLDVTLWQDGEVVAEQNIMTPDSTGLRDRIHHGSRVVVGSPRLDGRETGQLLHVGAGEIQQLMTIAGERAPWGAGTLDGRLIVVDFDGDMRTYAPDGSVADEFDTGVDMRATSVRVATDGRDRVALSRPATLSGFSQIDVIDREQDTVRRFRVPGEIANLGFARDGEVLVLQSRQGSVRLRDIDAGVTSGVIWDGDGAAFNEPWYDESSDSVWIASRDQIVELSLGRDAWRARACQKVGRELTADEWERLVPGDGAPVSSCAGALRATESEL